MKKYFFLKKKLYFSSRKTLKRCEFARITSTITNGSCLGLSFCLSPDAVTQTNDPLREGSTGLRLANLCIHTCTYTCMYIYMYVYMYVYRFVFATKFQHLLSERLRLSNSKCWNLVAKTQRWEKMG